MYVRSYIMTHLSVHLKFVFCPWFQVGWSCSFGEEKLGPHQQQKVIEQETHQVLRPSDLKENHDATVMYNYVGKFIGGGDVI